MGRSIILGIDCEAYLLKFASRTATLPIQDLSSTLANYTASDWIKLDTIRDVTLNMTFATADVTTRASGGYRQTVPTLTDASVDFAMRWVPDTTESGGTAFNEIITQALDKCPIAMLFLDGDLCMADCVNWYDTVDGRCSEDGARQGLFADFAVTNFTRNEGLEDGVFVDVTVVTTVGNIYPEWVTFSETT